MDLLRLVERFTEAWNTTDPEGRRRLVEETCAPTLEVVSPYGEHRGLDAQLATIAEVRAQFPRLHCTAKIVAQHHEWVLDAWTTDFGGDRAPLHGIDVSRVDADGRIARVISFSPLILE